MIGRIAKFDVCQKLITKTKNPLYLEKLNRTLPMVESIFASGCYSLAIAQSDKIEKERKPSMHYQNLICGATGVLISRKLDKFITKHKEYLCKELERRDIHKVNNIVKGVRVAIPLVVFSFFLRFFMPIVSVPISTWIEEQRKKKKKVTDCNKVG